MKKFLKIIPFIILFLWLLPGCSRSEESAEERGGIYHDIEYKQAPVLTNGCYVYNVKDFGAAGDGKQDDYQAIRDVLEYAASSGGGTIYFPEGSYLLNQPLNIDMEGDAPLLLTGDDNLLRKSIIKTEDKKSESDFITVSRENVSVSHLKLQNTSRTGALLKLQSNNSIVTGCEFEQGSQSGKTAPVVISGSDNYIASCEFNGRTKTGYSVHFTKEYGIEANNNTLADCNFEYGIRKVLIDTQEEGACQRNVTIARNLFVCLENGQINTEAVDGCFILDNLFDCTQTCVILNPDSTGIRNVEIRNNFIGAGWEDIKIIRYSDTGTFGAIMTETSGGGTISGVQITDNYFHRGDYGIRITSPNFTGFTILNNYFIWYACDTLYIKESIENHIEGNLFSSRVSSVNIKIENADEQTIFQNNIVYGTAEIPEHLDISTNRFRDTKETME